MKDTGFADSKGNLNQSAFVATAGNDKALATKIENACKGCTSKATDTKTKVWELASCYFTAMSK